MKIKVSLLARLRRKLAGFSIVEAAVGMGVVGTAMAALFSGFTTGFFTIRMARENLRATQIMLEKMETIRLYSWDQVKSNGFIKTNIVAQYDPYAPTNTGLVYTGMLTISPAPVDASYSSDMRLITVRLNWKTGNIERSREFHSYISRYGLQDYIY